MQNPISGIPPSVPYLTCATDPFALGLRDLICSSRPALAEQLPEPEPPAPQQQAAQQRFTVDGERCAIPFEMKGVTYYDCTTLNNEGVEWCA